MFGEDKKRISRRLRDALVADLVMEHLDAETDQLLGMPMLDERDWTEHLGRQLGMSSFFDQGVHDTLLLVVEQLDELIKTWPPSYDVRSTGPIVHEATKSLTGLECHATLLVGPPDWRSVKIPASSRLDQLGSYLQPLLEKAMAKALSSVLEQWVKWDTRNLADKRAQAVRAAEKAKTTVPANHAGGPPSRRATRDERRDRIAGHYIPPPRT